MILSTGHYVLLTFVLSLSETLGVENINKLVKDRETLVVEDNNKLVKDPDKPDDLFSDVIRLIKESDRDLGQKLVSDLQYVGHLSEDFVKRLFNEVNQLQTMFPIDIKENPVTTSDIDTKPTESPSTTGSLLERGVKYIKGLFSFFDSKPQENKVEPKQATADAPSPEEECIISDIVKYFEGIVENSAAFEKILKYIVSYVHRNVHFWLFTKGENGYQILQIGNISSVNNSNFKKSKKTVMLIHGWVNSGNNHYAQSMIEAFDNYGDYNIISVDWSELAYSFYTTSRIAVNFIGPYVATMVDFLSQKHELKTVDLHILGHSLGAHISGIAGMYVKSGKVGRITGFDPASPLFADNQKYRLDASDGKFVDVIHTSIFGMGDAIGSIDFYPNGGGPSQPGCGLDIAICPHRRSYQYFIASMTDDKFLAFQCNSWDSFIGGKCWSRSVLMGMNTPPWRKGIYYLRTSGEPPYALGLKTLNPPDESISLQANPR